MNLPSASPRFAICASFIFVLANPAFAAEVIFDNTSGDNTWETETNWDTGLEATGIDTITIPGGFNVTRASQLILDRDVIPPGTLDIQEGASLTISGELQLQGAPAAVNIGGSLIFADEFSRVKSHIAAGGNQGTFTLSGTMRFLDYENGIASQGIASGQPLLDFVAEGATMEALGMDADDFTNLDGKLDSSAFFFGINGVQVHATGSADSATGADIVGGFYLARTDTADSVTLILTATDDEPNGPGPIVFDNGGGDNTWENPLNWDRDFAARPADTITIPAGQNVTRADLFRLQAEIPGTLDIQEGASLTITGDLQLDQAPARVDIGGALIFASGGTKSNMDNGPIQGTYSLSGLIQFNDYENGIASSGRALMAPLLDFVEVGATMVALQMDAADFDNLNGKLVQAVFFFGINGTEVHNTGTPGDPTGADIVDGLYLARTDTAESVTLTLTSTESEALKITSIIRNPDGTVTLEWNGVVGTVYAVEYNFALDGGGWEEIVDDQTDTFTDTTFAPGAERIFYRVRELE